MIGGMRTEPPGNWGGHEWHFLCSERAMGAIVCQWMSRDGRWASCGEAGLITPEEMARRGWEYLGPVPVPREPGDD